MNDRAKAATLPAGSLDADPALGADMRAAIERFLIEYARCLDEDRLEAWPNFFLDDGCYQVLSRENVEHGLPAPIIYHYSRGMIEDRVTSLRDALTYEPVYTRHMVSNVYIVGVEAGVYRVISNYALYQTTIEGRTDLYSVGRCEDAIVVRDGRLKFKTRTVIADTFAVKNNMALPI
ncbi:MAG: aromatic-ring-hydroxylating dioxygenase subunit beta [Alphaproteobacteria bacterium]|nr:aromatic-ring-hydroxylating dioxygenase subunit beta [Alphaproteobacteria bacterium]